MEMERAYEIVGLLAEGRDPYTREELPQGSPYQQGDTVRALSLALDGLKLMENKRKKADLQLGNSGQPWSKEEDRELVKAFKCGQSISELARSHQRTSGAIASRLTKLGVMK
ncbi:hypothetical protein [Ammoniphilus sp. CFH 90114]|uniref:hypothetical protein n=1 Tax=Ammoniphilus sp. CFH 90114 TaxID=2493665 RepID=UPI00100F2E4B|nr:hypothetical protein [Ammoniphilus sp. CFH 90114]RXT02764.1 hypothetical protein EIZ39_24525 [Ammoniphilus sp. CFH 90114]